MENVKSNIKGVSQRIFFKYFTIFISFPLIFLVIHLSFYFSTKSIVKANQSVNPEATEYFIHANVIATLWINILHDYLFINYDSKLMKPFLVTTNYFFQKGEYYINPKNAENAVWWFLTYSRIYKIHSSFRNDNSMNIYFLSKDEEMRLRYKLTDYIINLGENGVKGVDFGKYTISAMHSFFGTHFSHINIDKHYLGDTEIQRVRNFKSDKNLYNAKVKSYESYRKFLGDKKNQDKDWLLTSLNNLSTRLNWLIAIDIKNGILNNCSNIYIPQYLKSFEKLIISLSITNNSISNRGIKNEFWKLSDGDLILLDILENSCNKYNKEIKEIKQKLNKLEGQENGN
ncbi:hypothetical protein CRV08_04685 [Halarcobacter ebronensis]|uniref:Uncharacterized protein n=1 Tax=Halarcobacter ebronensis TaxID=1462615 RepID=A0A4Q0YJE9_9BACT|nr:hypothetical protein [Halarcobacter ebronensis]RXJ69309.1 hypothetical protein CRV08_04685 [Halarcobacter ebronensis]